MEKILGEPAKPESAVEKPESRAQIIADFCLVITCAAIVASSIVYKSMAKQMGAMDTEMTNQAIQVKSLKADKVNLAATLAFCQADAAAEKAPAKKAGTKTGKKNNTRGIWVGEQAGFITAPAK